LELRHLRYIIASARNGSFSAAAHELNVRQPIVSKRIKEVEDELGTQLFDRSTAGARLTLAGEEFVVSCRRIIEDVERLAERAKARGEGELGRIVVGFYKSLSSGGLRAALRSFRQRYPRIEVELIESPFIELTAGVLAGTIDIAVILGDAGASIPWRSGRSFLSSRFRRAIILLRNRSSIGPNSRASAS
jgi:DNA-binding transcriptional LysR family regulator